MGVGSTATSGGLHSDAPGRWEVRDIEVSAARTRPGGAHRAVTMNGTERTDAHTDDVVHSRPSHRCARGAPRSRPAAPRCAHGRRWCAHRWTGRAHRILGAPHQRTSRPRPMRTTRPGPPRTPISCDLPHNRGSVKATVKGSCDIGTRLDSAPLGSGIAHHHEPAAHHRMDGCAHRPHHRTDSARTDRTTALTARAPTAPWCAPPHPWCVPSAPCCATAALGVESTVRSGLHPVEPTVRMGGQGGLHPRCAASGGSARHRGGEWTASEAHHPPQAVHPPCPPPLPATSPLKTGSARGRRILRPRAPLRPVRLRPRPPAARRGRRRGRRRGTGRPCRPPACTRSGTRPRSTRCARHRPRGTTASGTGLPLSPASR